MHDYKDRVRCREAILLNKQHVPPPKKCHFLFCELLKLPVTSNASLPKHDENASELHRDKQDGLSLIA